MAKATLSMAETLLIGEKYEIKDPHKVVKLALVVDSYKEKKIPELWIEAEEKAMKTLAKNFTPEDLIHEERKKDKKLLWCFRYYTPKDNYTIRETVQ